MDTLLGLCFNEMLRIASRWLYLFLLFLFFANLIPSSLKRKRKFWKKGLSHTPFSYSWNTVLVYNFSQEAQTDPN